MSEKKCSRCNEIKSLSEFKSWTLPDGTIKYRSECKACGKDYERKYNSRYYKAVTVIKRRKNKNNRDDA